MRTTTIKDACLDELTRLRLERNALELDVCGYTVVEEVIDPNITARGLEATLATFGNRVGKRPDVATGQGYEGYWVSRYVMLQDPAFESILMAEKVLAFVPSNHKRLRQPTEQERVLSGEGANPEAVPVEVLARNSDRFATLMGMNTMYGWNDNQDDWHRNWSDRDRTRYSPKRA